VALWRNQSIVEVLSVIGGSGAPFGFTSDNPMGPINLIGSTREVPGGAASVFRMIDLCGDSAEESLGKLYSSIVLFRAVTDWGYGLVAARRAKL
jgi:hypothetical protein